MLFILRQKIPKLLYLILHKTHVTNESITLLFDYFIRLFTLAFGNMIMDFSKNFRLIFTQAFVRFDCSLEFCTLRNDLERFGGIIPRRMSHSDEKCAHKQLHWNKMLARVLRLMTVGIAKTHKKMNYRLKLVMVDVNGKCWHTILWRLPLL